jgi:very-short-patch-repair endonuclease
VIDEAAIAAIARRQYGLLTGAQLRVHMTRATIERRIRRGLLVRVRPGIFRLAGVPQTWLQETLAVCLGYGGAAVASHRSAARLWDLVEVPSRKIEVTIPGRRNGQMPGVITHRADVPLIEMTRRLHIPVTRVERTLIDLSSVTSNATLERAVDDALRQGHTTIAKLDQKLTLMPAGGGRRLRALRRLVADRSAGYRPGDNDWEDRLYRWIVAAGLPAPRRQCWVVVNGARRRLDLAYPEPKIAIEYDGWDTHRLRRHFDDDRTRTIELQLAGWLVLPFTSRSTEAVVLDTVGRALARRLS